MIRVEPPALRRPLAYALFATQVLVGVAVPLADAVLDEANARTEVHLETRDAAGCAKYHDDVFCTFCRALDNRAPSAGQGGAVSNAPVATQRPGSTSVEREPANAFCVGGAGPRAPPR